MCLVLSSVPCSLRGKSTWSGPRVGKGCRARLAYSTWLPQYLWSRVCTRRSIKCLQTESRKKLGLTNLKPPHLFSFGPEEPKDAACGPLGLKGRGAPSSQASQSLQS